MIARETFEVGDKVCVVDRYHKRIRVSTVARIGKRKLTLQDGSGWFVDGSREWGCGYVSCYTGPDLRKAKPGDEEEIARANLALALSTVRWEDLPLDALIDVTRIVNSKECK